MIRRNHVQRVAVAGSLAGLTLGLLVAPPASASPMSACVNKKTGAMTWAKKKCKKGWKKITWNQPGPQGAPGAAGPNYSVVDATGAAVGQFATLRWVGAGSEVRVTRDGGFWNYNSTSGKLSNTGFVYYTNATCTGAAFRWADTPDYAGSLAASAGGPGRTVIRREDGSAPARAYAVTTTVTPVAASTGLWSYDSSDGSCDFDFNADPGEFLVSLQDVTAPPDFVGPLRIT